MGFEKKKKRRPSVKTAGEPYSEERWEIERDLEAITRAVAVKADPERMKKVKAMAKEKLEENRLKKESAQQAIELAQ